MSHKQKNIGLVLTSLAAVLLFGNLGLFNLGNIFGASVLASIGFLFGGLYYKNHKHIWALLSGTVFFSAATAVLNPAMAGTFFLVTMALGCMLVYKNDNKQWWAIIPTGLFASVATVAAIEERFTVFSSNSELFFFFGMAATFSYLYFKLAKKWAVYPAVGFIIITILASSFSINWFSSIIFLAIGVYLLKSKRLNINNSNRIETINPVS